MSKLSKLLKKAAKNPIVRGAVKLAAGAISKNNPKLGAQVVKAGQVLKGAGISPIAPSGIPQPKIPTNVAVLVAKSTPALPKNNSARVSMPGGAPIRNAGTSSTRQPGVKGLVKAPAKRRRKAASRPATATKSKTKGKIGGKGSLDLKATSAKWKKAGKPGKWIDFVKSSGVKRK